MLSRQQAAELSCLQQEVDRLRRDLATANGHLSDLRKKLRNVRKEEAMPANVFLDPEEDFGFQLTQTWAMRIPASEKGRLALGGYRLGEEFLKTLRGQPQEKQKNAHAIVDLLTNDPAKFSAREAHQLRTSAAGGSEPVTATAVRTPAGGSPSNRTSRPPSVFTTGSVPTASSNFQSDRA